MITISSYFGKKKRGMIIMAGVIYAKAKSYFQEKEGSIRAMTIAPQLFMLIVCLGNTRT
ncbi:hypothetical protein Bca4012_100756 [Brassica carinata]